MNLIETLHRGMTRWQCSRDGHVPEYDYLDYRCTRCGEQVSKAEWGVQHVRPDYRLFDGLRKGWGLQVDWWEGGISKKAREETPDQVQREGRLSGFEPGQRPRAGDLFYTDMQSGRRLLWLVVAAEHKYDPSDMYFADVYGLGYEDDLQLPERPEPAAAEPGRLTADDFV